MILIQTLYCREQLSKKKNRSEPIYLLLFLNFVRKLLTQHHTKPNCQIIKCPDHNIPVSNSLNDKLFYIGRRIYLYHDSLSLVNQALRRSDSYSQIIQSEYCKYLIPCSDWLGFFFFKVKV